MCVGQTDLSVSGACLQRPVRVAEPDASFAMPSIEGCMRLQMPRPVRLLSWRAKHLFFPDAGLYGCVRSSLQLDWPRAGAADFSRCGQTEFFMSGLELD